MRLFIDSAQFADWEKLAATGLLYGATTNPLILQKQGMKVNSHAYETMILRAQDLGLKELQIQVSGLENPVKAAESIKSFYKMWPAGVVAKVPLAAGGLAVLEYLPPEIPITFTAAYSSQQAILAAAKSSRYIAPYYGRLLEAAQPADKIVDDMLAICEPKGVRVLVASLRSAEQVVFLAERGHDTFTLSPAVFDELLHCDETEEATAVFEAAAKQ